MKLYTPKPIRDMIVVDPQEAAEKTPSGIYIPPSADEKIVVGLVLAVGPGHVQNGKRVPLEVKVGDKVAYHKNAAVSVKVDSSTFSLLKEEHILCVL